jgi:hypothetical protein
MSACVRCGACHGDYQSTCVECGFRPYGEGLCIAWLLSTHYLEKAEVVEASSRIRMGETLNPSPKMLREARSALGRTFWSDPGLSTSQMFGVFLMTLFLTPLVGWVLWAWWRIYRPRAAWQALACAVPSSVFFFVLVLWVLNLGA